MKPAADKKKILLITPNYMDYTDIIRSGIHEYLNAETHLITTTGNELNFTYRNSFHRIKNFFSKLFLKKNQKKIFYNEVVKGKLEAAFEINPQFDDILILRPDLIKEHLPFIKAHGKRSIAYFWDSFSRIPDGKEAIQFFDKFFSFEPRDVKDHQLLFLPNFYSPDLVIYKNVSSHFDLSYVASYDDRLETLEKILVSLSPLDLKTNINIIATKEPEAKNKNEKSITWFTDVLPRKETIRIMGDSRVLLDIAQSKQDGLSFRIFEAMKLGKKIITTNQSVTTYDFYDPRNIFVWENENTIPARDFFTAPYSPPPVEILNKYSLQKWIATIFE
ncbi:MAG TPA: hypothetical protein VFZ33_05850 [Chitinophagaceae bacterium]